MTYVKYDLSNEKVCYLIQTDEMLGELIRYIKTCELAIEEDGYKCLVKYIVGQQISDKARETIWQRFYVTFGNVTPEILLAANISEFRKIGLSRNKVDYIKNLAACIVEKKINFEQLSMLSNKKIITELTSLRGIGEWTAEMYLIFSLGRNDVFAKGDATIRRAIQWMYNLKELPSLKVLTGYFNNWIKYATIASLFLWKATTLGLIKEPFSKIIQK
ncbi:MAG: DNA-3-methyladenine glycosylase 2 family protein [Roseburia sp.]|nr:DNA-3-methyladenine glycosylase 2 family protein [Roseburia sp.]